MTPLANRVHTAFFLFIGRPDGRPGNKQQHRWLCCQRAATTARLQEWCGSSGSGSSRGPVAPRTTTRHFSFIALVTMDRLPNELLLHVLAFLDGASLVRCKRVCKQWQIVVTAILMHGNALWRMICLSEIDPEVLAELQGGLE
ncbi:hypothetical protein V5799_021307 [Amblyomma americanum]|uniref:F-box domain-containing protein n=1 Tax=Amblyomma americanum TaxID=6943 RepID=A0AAQ4FPC1_AMBAM